MLHLTEEGHRLGPPIGGGANNEFLIPTELHELFCWVHQLQPLDLMGKPWSNYHLELQLLQVFRIQSYSLIGQREETCLIREKLKYDSIIYIF